MCVCDHPMCYLDLPGVLERSQTIIGTFAPNHSSPVHALDVLRRMAFSPRFARRFPSDLLVVLRMYSVCDSIITSYYVDDTCTGVGCPAGTVEPVLSISIALAFRFSSRRGIASSNAFIVSSFSSVSSLLYLIFLAFFHFCLVHSFFRTFSRFSWFLFPLDFWFGFLGVELCM